MSLARTGEGRRSGIRPAALESASPSPSSFTHSSSPILCHLRMMLNLRRFLSGLSPPRLLILALIACALLLVPTYIHLRPDLSDSSTTLWAPGGVQRGGAAGAGGLLRVLSEDGKVNSSVLDGGVIMPRLGNETLK